MNPFEIISFEGSGCGAFVEFAYKGETYKTDYKVLNAYFPPVPTYKWTINNIRWAFVPPNLTDAEKEQFVEALNAYRDTALIKCKECCFCLEHVWESDMALAKATFKAMFGTDNLQELAKRQPPIKSLEGYVE